MNITPVRSKQDWRDAQAIRERVFIEEQGCSAEEEWDGNDETSRHVLGRLDDAPIATARWRSVPHGQEVVAKLERFAVLSEHRGHGYGTQLVRYVLSDAHRAGFDVYLIHAQVHLEEWYQQFGFDSIGERFEEAGIPHIQMVKREDTEAQQDQK